MKVDGKEIYTAKNLKLVYSKILPVFKEEWN
jgi:hypothetical protein